MTFSSLVLALSLAAGGEPAPPTEAACVRIRELPVGGASLVHERCGEGGRLRLCRGDACEPLACVEVATVPPEAWVDTILPLRDGDRRGALAVFRIGEGGHLELRPVLPVEGEPVCIGGPKVDEGMKRARSAARRKLAKGEHLDGRGGRISTDGDRVLVTTRIYRGDEPACCPTGGTLRTVLRLREGRLHVLSVKRQPTEQLPPKPLPSEFPDRPLPTPSTEKTK